MKRVITILLFVLTAFSCKDESSNGTKEGQFDNIDTEVALQDAILIDTNDLRQETIIYLSYSLMFIKRDISNIPSRVLQELRINESKSDLFYSLNKKRAIKLDTDSKGFMIYKMVSDSSLSVQGNGWKATSTTWETDSTIFLKVYKEDEKGKFYLTPEFYKLVLQ